MVNDESEQHLVHRLEAFSDIVIGFSLAQLGLSLTIPKHASDIFSHVHGATGIFAVVITFGLICAVWWAHNRLFRHLFIPSAPNILANFAALCGVIFLAYSMQLLVRADFQDRVAYCMYTGSYGWIMLLFSFIAWNGLRVRGARMNAGLRTQSTKFAVRTTIVAAWFILVTVLTSALGLSPETAQWLFLVLAVALIAQRMISRRVSPAASETN